MKTRYWLIALIAIGVYCGTIGFKEGRGAKGDADERVIAAEQALDAVTEASALAMLEMQDSLNDMQRELLTIRCVNFP